MKKSRILKKTRSKHNVPEELLTEILSRLSVKSLLRFRCVCSSWQALIDDSNFARLHLTCFNYSNRNESRLFLFQSGKYASVECVLRRSKTLRATPKLGFELDVPWDVSCWVDGLFMLKESANADTRKLMLWNPSIRKTRSLSLPPEISSKLVGYFDFGLGFDPLIKDYKFVRYVLKSGIVSVYTVGTNSWKTIDNQGKGSSGYPRIDYFCI